MEKGVIEQYLVILSFFVIIVILMIGEAAWLKRKGWASFGKSLGFSVLTNVIGFALGFVVIFIIVAIFIISAFNGKTQQLAGDIRDIVLLILALIITPALLIISKRLFLSILKMQTGKSAWLFSIVSSVLSMILSLGIPILFGYLLFRS